MIVTLSRILKYGWQGFLRNGLLSFSTISIMLLSSLVFSGLMLLNVVGKSAVQSIQEKIDISVYFKSNISEDSILNIKRSLEGLDEVKSVEYISRDEALAVFKEKHQEDTDVTQTLDELEANPLLASLNIKAKDPHAYNAIADYLEAGTLKDQISKVTYAQNQVVIDKLIAIIDTMRNGGMLLTLFLAFLAVTVIFTTIRLAIYSNSEQIGIMRMVGASNSFIRGPFIVEGMMYGLVAAVVGLGIMFPIVNASSPYIVRFIPEMDLRIYLQANFIAMFGYQLLFSVGLGVFSSVIAIRKYLHI